MITVSHGAASHLAVRKVGTTTAIKVVCARSNVHFRFGVPHRLLALTHHGGPNLFGSSWLPVALLLHEVRFRRLAWRLQKRVGAQGVPIRVLGVHHLLAAHVLNQLILLELLAHVVFVQLQLALLGVHCHDLRDHATDQHGDTADEPDRPGVSDCSFVHVILSLEVARAART